MCREGSNHDCYIKAVDLLDDRIKITLWAPGRARRELLGVWTRWNSKSVISKMLASMR